MLFPSLLLSSLQNQSVGPFFCPARFHSECVFAPRGLRVLQTNRCPPFATSMRMIHSIHGGSPHTRSSSLKASSTGIFHSRILKFRIGNHPNGSEGFTQHFPYFARREYNLSILSFLRIYFCSIACRTYQNSSVPSDKFNVIHLFSRRNIF